MNGAPTRTYPRNVTVEDEPEPADPPSHPLSPFPQSATRSSPKTKHSLEPPPSPKVITVSTPASDEREYMTQLSYTNALIRQSTMPILPPDLDDFGIPSSPPGTPDPTLSSRLENFRQLRERGVYFNDRLCENKGFRNPKLLEKLCGYVGIEDEHGSHLPTTIWNPNGFSENQYFDKLGTFQF